MSSSVGIILPNIWKNKIHVPNHQPVTILGIADDRCFMLTPQIIGWIAGSLQYMQWENSGISPWPKAILVLSNSADEIQWKIPSSWFFSHSNPILFVMLQSKHKKSPHLWATKSPYFSSRARWILPKSTDSERRLRLHFHPQGSDDEAVQKAGIQWSSVAEGLENLWM